MHCALFNIMIEIHFQKRKKHYLFKAESVSASFALLRFHGTSKKMGKKQAVCTTQMQVHCACRVVFGWHCTVDRVDKD